MATISEQQSEKTLSSSCLYRGRIINVRQDRVKTPGGEIAFREVVEHPGAVAILAITADNEVILVRQYRQPAGKVLLEIPAGKLEPGEEPLQCARRELLEETGLEAGRWKEIFTFYPSPGFCDEIIYLFAAESLKTGFSTAGDPEENIIVERVPLAEAWAQVEEGEIVDGKTIIALQAAVAGAPGLGIPGE